MSEHPHLPGTRWDARVFDDDGSRHEPDAAELLAAAHAVMQRARRKGARAGRDSPQDGPGSAATAECTREVGGRP
jgi:hypothetical protein